MKHSIMRRFMSVFQTEDTNPNRIQTMEGLRGLAVTLVFLVHFNTLFSAWLDPNSATWHSAKFITSIGRIGVDLFLAITGYLIYGAVIKRPVNFSKFMQRRMMRIYPTFFVIFLMYLALSFVFSGESKLPESIFGKLTYILQNLFLLPGVFPIQPIITVSWTLSYDVFIYAALPILVQTLGMREWKPRNRVLFFLAIAIIHIIYCLSISGRLLRMLLFISGIILYELMNSYKMWKSLSKSNEWLAIVGFVFIVLPIIYIFDIQHDILPEFFGTVEDTRHYRVITLAATVWFFLLACFRSTNGILHRILTWRPLIWIGNVSFSLFLAHSLVLNFFELALKKIIPQQPTTPLLFWFILPIAYSMAFIAATVLYVTVEKPFSLEKMKSIKPQVQPEIREHTLSKTTE